MIDYTHPARERGRDSDLATALRAAADHTERLVRQAARAGADPTGR